MKFHQTSKSPATGPVITGHKDEVSTPTSFDPDKAFKNSCQSPQLSKSQDRRFGKLAPADTAYDGLSR